MSKLDDAHPNHYFPYSNEQFSGAELINMTDANSLVAVHAQWNVIIVM